MKLNIRVAAALAAVAGFVALPGKAQAQCNYSLGLGGYLTGCATGSVSRIGEDAGDVSTFGYFVSFAGNSGSLADHNAPLSAETPLFDDNCGSSGNGTFSFCNPNDATPFAVTPPGELVFAMLDPTVGDYAYSGDLSRNAVPAPAGYQAVLLHVSDYAGTGDQFVLAWEDQNTGCTQISSSFPTTITTAQYADGSYLNTEYNDCTALTPGGKSDSDYNDFFMLITTNDKSIPLPTVPEPMTMSLMAFGLVGLGGASLRRRIKKS